ncbi:uncharacterized protein LOC132753564 isoform X2 [Ruditapes philippinarum]|uniref:uncharacterized protein LOC132753564 isoform X2 n=1 Tax=Ruditapes philippinarum TaxID=129788 RepID=UPI00295BC49C|nr:uncharacterized protein LOC132753564 isoform X2 [Ruditapes philippinarum]
MSRTFGVCWIFLWISAAANVTAYYVLSNETASWDNAKSRGNFATPTIQGNNSSWFNINITSDLNENETAWVGYYKKETAFAYIGCSLLNKTVPNGLLPTRKNSPGNCFSLCKETYHSYIGLNKGNCFCLSELPSGNITLSKCDISPNGDWIAGGNDCMSLYQKIRADIHVTRGGNSGKCLVFEARNNELYWTRCEEYDQTLCKNGSAIVSAQYYSQTYFSWKHYVKACFEINLSPISYNDTLNSTSISQANGPTSTNVIRSDAIYRFNEKPNAISTDDSVKYGYITKRGNITFLLFTETSSNKRYLLQIDSETGLNLTSEQIRTTTTPTSTTKTTRKPLDNGTTPRHTSSLPIKSSSITTSSIPSVNDGITNSSEPMQSISVTSISEKRNSLFDAARQQTKRRVVPSIRGLMNLFK